MCFIKKGTRSLLVIFTRSVTVHINNAAVVVCNEECSSLLLNPALHIADLRCGSSQILWAVRQEGRRRRRWGERSRSPDPSGSGSVGWWRRTAPKTVPELLWGSTSASPLLQTAEQRRRITLPPKMSQGYTTAGSVTRLNIWLCFNHLHQASQTHTEQHVCGNLSQGGRKKVVRFHADTWVLLEQTRILKMMPPKQADIAICGYPCLATVMSEKQSAKEMNRV